MTHAKAQGRKGNAFAAKVILNDATFGVLASPFMYSLRLCALA
jgi:hypothetical protein